MARTVAGARFSRSCRLSCARLSCLPTARAPCRPSKPCFPTRPTDLARLLIRNARVLTLDEADREWPRADIAIEDGSIQKLGAGSGEAGRYDRVIDAEGMLAMPGLINAHFHSSGNLMKGCLPGLPLELFMLYEVPPLAAEGDAERLAYVRTLLGALEMLRRGVTAVHDDAYHVPVAQVSVIDAIMRAYDEVGIRAAVAI